MTPSESIPTPRTESAISRCYKMPAHSGEIMKEEMAKLEQELQHCQLQLKPTCCGICWTNSWAPADKDEEDAVLDPHSSSGSYMICQCCMMTKHAIKRQQELQQAQELNEFVTKGSFEASAVMAKENSSLRTELQQAREELTSIYKFCDYSPTRSDVQSCLHLLQKMTLENTHQLSKWQECARVMADWISEDSDYKSLTQFKKKCGVVLAMELYQSLSSTQTTEPSKEGE